MNAPKKKPSATWAGATWRKKLLIAEYHALDLLQAPFGLVFWRIEQAKARIQDSIDNAKGGQ